jgi:hypothetical protein
MDTCRHCPARRPSHGTNSSRGTVRASSNGTRRGSALVEEGKDRRDVGREIYMALGRIQQQPLAMSRIQQPLTGLDPATIEAPRSSLVVRPAVGIRPAGRPPGRAFAMSNGLRPEC